MHKGYINNNKYRLHNENIFIHFNKQSMDYTRSLRKRLCILNHQQPYTLYVTIILYVQLCNINGKEMNCLCTTLWLGYFEDLRPFYRYFSHIATWKQEITNMWNRSGETGSRTRTSCSAIQELSHYTTAAPMTHRLFWRFTSFFNISVISRLGSRRYQICKIAVGRPGLEPRTSCSTRQELFNQTLHHRCSLQHVQYIYWKEKETHIHFGCYLYQICINCVFKMNLCLKC